ncbi:MAG TPA: SDR family oxidoreductase, partial [Herpetosiphonaceae bacterium]
ACVSGVLTLEDALRLVATRAQLIQQLPAGAMLAVAASEAAVQPYLGDGVCLAVVNSPTACVLAGPPAALAAVSARLEAAEIACRPIETSHAFHSTMLAPIAAQVTALARRLTLSAPRIPYVSNVTGTWITAEQATNPDYWAQHMVQTVRFADGVGELLQQTDLALLEVGPGQTLGFFARQHPACTHERMSHILHTLRGRHERQDDQALLLTTLGRLWLLDVPIDWQGFYADETRRRIALPTYPFERQRFWIEPKQGKSSVQVSSRTERRPDLTNWFAMHSWKRGSPITIASVQERLAQPRCWLLFLDQCGIGQAVARRLDHHQQHVVTVTPGAGFDRTGPTSFTIRPSQREDYDALLRELSREQKLPDQIVHLWNVTPPINGADETEAGLANLLDHGFYSLFALCKALGEVDLEHCHISVISSEMQEVTGTEQLCPAKATVLGPIRMVREEYLNLSSRSIDIVLPGDHGALDAFAQRVVSEVLASDDEQIVALRGPHRWAQSYEPSPLAASNTSRLRTGGVYLITGGLGGIGLAMAEHLADTYQARLVLVGRSPLPPREEWSTILETADTTTGAGRRIKIVQQLEARTDVLVLQADVADAAQMRAVVDQALARFGTINGVLHAAGVPGVGIMQRKTTEAAAAVLAPKVYGTLALSQALREVPLDFMVLFSSVTSATGGGPGQADYCAANAFLDAFARRYHHHHGMTVAISWGEWLWDAWQEGLLGFPEDVRAMLVATRRAYGISFDEGAEALQRALSHDVPHVFVTTQDVLAMVEFSRKSSAAEVFKQLQEERQSRPLYPRPPLGTPYVAPSNEVEEEIVNIIGDVLRIEQIGIHDNFFDLGGNSLIGIQIIARLRRFFQTDVPITIIFDAPTVSEMAFAIEMILIEEITSLDETEVEELIQHPT